MRAPDLILHNGAITTLDPARPQVSAVAITGGRIAATGGEELRASADEKTARNIHVIRGGLDFNMELRWDEGLGGTLLSIFLLVNLNK
ncbi:MAG: hypothetical protein NDI77_14380 [Geobacteraceae bacterium]|nr:hypothetical protein [Geobacteraceae bacterium]